LALDSSTSRRPAAAGGGSAGRRDLWWEESVRLDQRWVENWSTALDALIVYIIFGAVPVRP